MSDMISAGRWTDLVHPILPRCVGDSYGRFDLSRPFVIEEYVYATDARIAVRMPVPEMWTIPNPAKFPRADDLFGRDDWSRYPWRAEPTQFPPVEGDCKACEGRKVLPEVTCPWCHGEEGWCDECWQLEGKIPAGPCYECWGTGILDAHGRIEVVPGYWLMRKYVALLHEFAMTTYLPVKLDPKQVTRFTQGDVTGILMPMTPPDARKMGDR